MFKGLISEADKHSPRLGEGNQNTEEQTLEISEDEKSVGKDAESSEALEIKQARQEILDLDTEEGDLIRELLLEKKVMSQAAQAGIDGFGSHTEEFSKRIQVIEELKRNWAEKHGEENLPEGLDLNENEEQWRSRFDGPKNEGTQEPDTSKEAKERRQEVIDDWKKKAVKHFTEYIKNSWQTKDAVNLPVAVNFVEERLPDIMQKYCQNYINGKTIESPEVVWFHRKGTSLFDKVFSNKPEQIKDLKFSFTKDSDPVVIATEEELISDEEQTKIDSSNENRQDGDSSEEENGTRKTSTKNNGTLQK